MLEDPLGEADQMEQVNPKQLELSPSASRLALTVPIGKSETFQSFVSRLSKQNGCGFAQDFTRYMGIQWLDVVRGAQNSIDQVCDFLDDGFAEVGRYAIQTAGHHSYTINGQVLTSAALKRHQTQVCPLCIGEDIEQSGKNAAYGRAEWQLTPFMVCPLHSTLMFQLPRSFRPRSPHDFAGRVADHYPAIINAAGAASVVARESHFESYLTERLLGQSRNIWIDQMDLHVVCKLVQSLGDRGYAHSRHVGEDPAGPYQGGQVFCRVHRMIARHGDAG